MNEERMDAALKAMSSMVPKAPEKAVEEMIGKVQAMNARRQQLAGNTALSAEASAKAAKLPGSPSMGMKK